MVGECSHREMEGCNLVPGKGRDGLPDTYTVENKVQRVLFRLNGELASVMEGLFYLKKFVKEMLGKVISSLGLGLGWGNFRKLEKGKTKQGLSLGWTDPPHPKWGWCLKRNGLTFKHFLVNHVPLPSSKWARSQTMGPRSRHHSYQGCHWYFRLRYLW